MAALALENLLPDFGKMPVRAGDHATDPASLAALVSSRGEPAITQEMLETEVARAEAALRERLIAEHEAALGEERQRHEDRLAELNALLGGQAAEIISGRLDELHETVAGLVTSTVARILAVHLTAEIQKRMVERLGEAIRNAIRDPAAIRVRVRGPLSLYEALAASAGDLAQCFDYTEAPGLDLVASIDDSLFETRLADWSAALAEIVS
jgi:hypothetical protein